MDPINSDFELYEEVPYTVSLDILGSDFDIVERHLGGDCRPGGAGANFLKDLCTCLSSESEHLQEEISHWEQWLANNHPSLGIYPVNDVVLPCCP